MLCMDLKTNTDRFPIKCQIIGVYNQGGVCLLRGTNSIFKCR